jgi:hypothetical protein
MYCETNYPTKKAIRETIVRDGHAGGVFQPGLGPDAPANGEVAVEGPHYPRPHSWYAVATLRGGRIVKVK